MSAAKAWRVAFTRRAEEDIKGIFAFIADRDGPDIAETILNRFIQARDSLRELPDRGRIPPELKRVNILSYREIQVSPYRVVYQVSKAAHEVHIHVVADERRNFTELLKDRLLNIPSSEDARQ
ncbi:MAG: type II toxin-antitoxin system RelE/ParE family toxin [Desulfovibrio sp.]|uniref:type II toxin-antitoxin system RelE/ParE family toxin n=1 Tax=Desulfovibrio sp. TaxID=885 RepID=UPI0025C4E0BF|nr:type II toxin-antitoxin system RelE/ParE family toxin [Desulfovibrio sp.]MBS6830070.1 type II toxin-antitoxin system RelE/ParE family toxin [Desulfovibrio sp.]